jgi:hypothetical protein
MYAPAGVIDAPVRQVRLQPVPTYRVRSMSGDYLSVIEWVNRLREAHRGTPAACGRFSFSWTGVLAAGLRQASRPGASAPRAGSDHDLE